MQKWYCVCTSVYDNHTEAKVVSVVEAETQPESSFHYCTFCDDYNDWYGSMEEAEAAIAEAIHDA